MSAPLSASEGSVAWSMDIHRFIAERKHRWDLLSTLLETAEASPDRDVGPDRLREILGLYRRVCSDLNEARTYTANPELIGGLNQLAARGYRFVYRGGLRRPRGGSLRRFVLSEVPATFQKERAALAAAAVPLLFGILFGFAAVIGDPHSAEGLIPPAFFTESPRERVQKIEREDERIDSLDKAIAFGASLYTHNIQVAFLTFSLGALTIVAGAWILFYNGVLLGAVAGAYFMDGVQVFFLAWIGPHGALEIPAIVFGGAAGLKLGRALLLPGDVSRAASLRAAFPAVWRIMTTAIAILVMAGIVEGSFSQFTARSFPYPLKILVATILMAALLAYLFFPRRGSGWRPGGAIR